MTDHDKIGIAALLHERDSWMALHQAHVEINPVETDTGEDFGDRVPR